MPASIVIVHDDPTFLETTATLLRADGYDVAAFEDSMAAMNALESAAHVEVLVTRVNFPEGKPNGISLALVTRTKRPFLKVVFAGKPGLDRLTEDLGELVSYPGDLGEVVQAVTRALAEARRSAPQREA